MGSVPKSSEQNQEPEGAIIFFAKSKISTLIQYQTSIAAFKEGSYRLAIKWESLRL